MSNVRSIPATRPIDLARTTFPLRRGTGDPTMRIGLDEVWRATRTPEGPATLHLRLDPGTRIVVATAWGAGEAWALDRAAGYAGMTDDDDGFRPVHEVMRQLRRRLPGVRLTRTDRLMEALIPAVLEQKVTGLEARRAYRRLSSALGEPAPGPHEGLLLPPDPAAVAVMPYHAFHPFGLERRRAETLRSLCANATRIEALVGHTAPEARAQLMTYSGVGVWTAAEVARLALADADAVSVGDYHLPNVVAWAFAGEPRGTDERMLELLEPYAGHRGRVQMLLEAGGISAPRRGPRMSPREIERI